MNFVLMQKLYICLIIVILTGCGTRDRVVLIRGTVPNGESCFLDVATQSFDHRPRAISGSFVQDYTISGFGESFRIIEISCNRKVVFRKRDVPLDNVIDLGTFSEKKVRP